MKLSSGVFLSCGFVFASKLIDVTGFNRNHWYPKKYAAALLNSEGNSSLVIQLSIKGLGRLNQKDPWNFFTVLARRSHDSSVVLILYDMH